MYKIVPTETMQIFSSCIIKANLSFQVYEISLCSVISYEIFIFQMNYIINTITYELVRLEHVTYFICSRNEMRQTRIY